ncbi:MAG: GNAT family N-acetyltransferase [Oscillospiraceae bacterium]|jgi:RimJ/RimL family protein N-acetyltransferase|nr:GNAT family N-acetyltransferase [Oscillospiraceae bacterium]
MRKLPVLRGERVILRALRRSDIADRQAVGRHNEFSHMCGGDTIAPVSYPPRSFWVKWYRGFRREQHGFVIEAEGRCAGTARLNHISAADRSATYAIGIFDPAFYSQGMGTEVTRLMLRYGFETLGLHRIDLKVLEYNHRGIRCYEKCGFRREGVLRDSAWIDGAWHADVLMSILEDEYAAD